jgi:hypothetical protein
VPLLFSRTNISFGPIKAIVVGSASPVATVSTLKFGSFIVGSPVPIEATTPGILCCANVNCDEGIKTETNTRLTAIITPGNDDDDDNNNDFDCGW